MKLILLKRGVDVFFGSATLSLNSYFNLRNDFANANRWIIRCIAVAANASFLSTGIEPNLGKNSVCFMCA